MFGINLKKLETLRKLKDKYKNNKPFPHIYFSGLFEDDVLETIVKEDFVNITEWQQVKGKRRKANKFANNKIDTFSPTAQKLFNTLNGKEFMAVLKELTGIERNLVADRGLDGSGFACTFNGGSLGVHADRNTINSKPHGVISRRVNLILYLNKDWKDEYNGHLELYNTGLQCIKKYSPEFNKCIIFNVNDHAFHGHPKSLACPKDMNRKSITVYYGSNGRPVKEHSVVHGTLYKKMPGEK